MKRNRKVKVRNFLNTYTGEVVFTMNWTRRKRNELKTRDGKPSDWIITEKPLAELYESVNYRGWTTVDLFSSVTTLLSP